MGKSEKKGVTVQIGDRTIVAYKDYKKNIITVTEKGKEVYSGSPWGYHKWVRDQRKLAN